MGQLQMMYKEDFVFLPDIEDFADFLVNKCLHENGQTHLAS